MTVWGGVGDILSAICPFDFVTVVLHQADEVLAVTGQGHTLVDDDDLFSETAVRDIFGQDHICLLRFLMEPLPIRIRNAMRLKWVRASARISCGR